MKAWLKLFNYVNHTTAVLVFNYVSHYRIPGTGTVSPQTELAMVYCLCLVSKSVCLVSNVLPVVTQSLVLACETLVTLIPRSSNNLLEWIPVITISSGPRFTLL